MMEKDPRSSVTKTAGRKGRNVDAQPGSRSFSDDLPGGSRQGVLKRAPSHKGVRLVFGAGGPL